MVHINLFFRLTTVKQLGGTMETAVQQLVTLYGLNETEAQEKVKLYWGKEHLAFAYGVAKFRFWFNDNLIIFYR